MQPPGRWDDSRRAFYGRPEQQHTKLGLELGFGFERIRADSSHADADADANERDRVRARLSSSPVRSDARLTSKTILSNLSSACHNESPLCQQASSGRLQVAPMAVAATLARLGADSARIQRRFSADSAGHKTIAQKCERASQTQSLNLGIMDCALI